MMFQDKPAQRGNELLVGCSYWLRNKMANILGRHPSRWPVSPESGFMGFSEEIVEPSIPCHSNVDIGVLGNIFPPESLFEENIIPPLPALEATETPPKSAIVTGGEAPVRTTAINFSRPLVGRPSHHVALGLVDRPPSGDFAQFVASFPLPLITDPRNDSSQLESPQDIPTEEDLPFRNNIQPHQTSLVERFLSIHNLSSSLDVDSQSDTPKIKDRFIKRKRVPQQTISPKAQSFSACPDPSATASLRRGSSPRCQRSNACPVYWKALKSSAF